MFHNEEKESPQHAEINGIQKAILRATLELYHEDIASLGFLDAIPIMKMLIEDKQFSPNTWNILQKLNVSDSVEFIQKIRFHPAPQNRSEDYPYFGRHPDPNIVVFKNNQNNPEFEQRGLLGLSSRNDLQTKVTKQGVIGFMNSMMNDVITEKLQGHIDHYHDFYRALQKNNLEEVKKILGANPELANACYDDREETHPLFFAACHCSGDIISSLIEAGADKEYKNKKGQTPLFQAVLAYNTRAVSALLNAGAQAHIVDLDDKSAMDYVFRSDSYSDSICDLLLKAGCYPNRDEVIGHVLCHVSQVGSLDTLKKIPVSHFNYRGSYEQTALMNAVAGNREEMVEWLLSSNADPNLKNSSNMTALSYAWQLHPNLTEKLLQAGANPNIPEGSGENLLDLAIKYKREKDIDLLIKYRCLPICQDNIIPARIRMLEMVSEARSSSDEKLITLLFEQIEKIDRLLPPEEEKQPESINGRIGNLTIEHGIFRPFKLNTQHQYALQELSEYGLTEDHLKNLITSNGYFHTPHYKALVYLVKDQHMTIDEAMEEMNEITNDEARGITMGFRKNEIRGLHEQQILALKSLYPYGLTRDHLENLVTYGYQNNNLWFTKEHKNALIHLIKNKGMNVDEAINCLNGLNYHQAEALSRESVGPHL